jgi:hypothetical protein
LCRRRRVVPRPSAGLGKRAVRAGGELVWKARQSVPIGRLSALVWAMRSCLPRPCRGQAKEAWRTISWRLGRSRRACDPTISR